MKKETKIVIGLMIVFGLLTTGLSILNFNKLKDINQNELTIISNSKTVVYTLLELQELPSTTFNAEIRSTSQPNKDIQFTGVSFTQLLNAVDINDEFTSVRFKSVDGFETELSKDEVLQVESVYIVYQRDGQPILTKRDGGTGPLEMVVRLDPFSNRWNKYLIEIELIP